MGIVHGEASYLPDFLDYFSTNFPTAPVKVEILGKKDIETTTMANFYSQVSREQSRIKRGVSWCVSPVCETSRCFLTSLVVRL